MKFCDLQVEMGKIYNSALARGEKLDQNCRLSEIKIVSAICNKKREGKSVVEPPPLLCELGWKPIHAKRDILQERTLLHSLCRMYFPLNDALVV